MELFINEISYFPLALHKDEGRQRALTLALCLSEAQKQHFSIARCHDDGISSIRLCQDFSLADFCNENLRGISEQLLLTMIRPPYFQDNSDEETEYIQNSFHIDVPEGILSENKQSVECIGFAAAHLRQSIGINIASHTFWIENKRFSISRKTPQGKTQVCDVYAFSYPQDFYGDDFVQWQVKNMPRNFVDCGIKPDLKICNLSSDHHGNNILRDFARQSLFILPYISEVVTSIPYHPHVQSFVCGFQFEAKRLEVVLHWTEKGVGMVLQTTARTDLELRQIADELESRFGKGS